MLLSAAWTTTFSSPHLSVTMATFRKGAIGELSIWLSTHNGPAVLVVVPHLLYTHTRAHTHTPSVHTHTHTQTHTHTNTQTQ